MNIEPKIQVRDFTAGFAGKTALKEGKNTMAVHCRQTGGGQFVDVGIVDVK